MNIGSCETSISHFSLLYANILRQPPEQLSIVNMHATVNEYERLLYIAF